MAWIRVFLALAFLGWAPAVAAEEIGPRHPVGQARHAEHVRHIDVRVEVLSDNRLRITEQIDYCFGQEMRHGIHRNIPLQGWYGRQLGIEITSVEDGAGEVVHFERLKEPGAAKIRIGDPDRLVTGPQSYRIAYEVRGAIRGQKDLAELRWTAVGGGWEVPVDTATVHVRLPSDAIPLMATCRIGDLNPYSKTDCIEYQADASPGEIAYALTGPLKKSEQFDVRVELPREVFDAGVLSEAPPPPPKRLPPARGPRLEIEPPTTSQLIAIPLVLGPLFLLAGAFFGRDRGRRGSVAARSTRPKGLTPAEVQLLHTESLDRRAVAATILDLAVRGFIEIEPVLDYQVFHKRKEPKSEELRVHEWILYRALFETSASTQEANAIAIRSPELAADALQLLQQEESANSVPSARLRYSLPPVLGDFEAGIRERVIHREGLFVRSPRKQRRGWLLGLACALAYPALYVVISTGWLGALAMALTFGCAFQFVRMLPRRTAEGRRRHEEVLGLVEYLERVDQDRLDRHASVAAAEIVEPERLLPYALVLGSLESWREAMRDVHFEPPAWLERTLEGASNMTAQDLLTMADRLGHDIDSIPNSLERAIQDFELSPPSPGTGGGSNDSSGGGTSSRGGGGWSGGGSSGPLGGGGGGSW